MRASCSETVWDKGSKNIKRLLETKTNTHDCRCNTWDGADCTTNSQINRNGELMGANLCLQWVYGETLFFMFAD